MAEMRTVGLQTVIFSILLGACSSDASQKGPQKDTLSASKQIVQSDIKNELAWLEDLDDAFNQAKDLSRPVLVMISEPTCRWCVKMKKGALSDSRVRQELQKYTLVKIRRSDRRQSERIQGFDGKIPSFFVMTPDGEVLESVVGYFKPNDFLGYLKEISQELK